MKNFKPTLIGKSLENERNYYSNLKTNLFDDLLRKQINIFFSIYILSINDKNNVIENQNTLELYRNFYATKFNGIRFLLELFLTSLEVFSREDDLGKNNLAFSLALSEKINIHLINKRILALDPSNNNYLEALRKDQQNYAAFLSKYGKISPNIPNDIEDFFNQQGLSANDKKFEFSNKFGFKYFKHSKLNYGNIMRDNRTLKELIEKLKAINIFPPIIDQGFLLNMYSLISGEMHPTISIIESFEKFISGNKEEKEKIIFNGQENIDAFLKVIGVLMDALYKSSRGESLKNLKYDDTGNNQM